MKSESKSTLTPANVRSKALRFVLFIGVLSFFADFTYEGSRSIVGPYLATFGAGAAAIAIITGFGELLGYGLRLVSGRTADATGKFWPITLVGYFVQMVSIPLLALAGNWQWAAVLIILERVGKAIRNPPRDVMLSHAGKQLGQGWVFGTHEALDQFGALFGPLLVAAILAHKGDYRMAFAVLLVPGTVCLTVLLIARFVYPTPEDMEVEVPNVHTGGLPRQFWFYLAGAALVAAGFADYPLIAYHFQKTASVSKDFIPVFYAVAMGVSGTGSLLLGRLFDRLGFSVLIGLTMVTALFAPLVFWGNFWGALAGAALWGLGMGAHESIIPAAVAPMVSVHHRASAYGLFTAGYGIFWFLGSVGIGLFYQQSVTAAVVFCLAIELSAIPFFLIAKRKIDAARTLHGT